MVIIRKVRRDGNSLVVTIPVEKAEAAKLHAGDYVQVETDETTGGLLILPLRTRPHPNFVEIGSQIIDADRSLLDLLAK
jgi:antitoxin component of MazEF toxin-antitoxin module